MSGGIGLTAKDLGLPNEHDAGSVALPEHNPSRRFLSFRQLNALALSIILAVSGMVPIFDLAFSVLSLPYIFFLSRFAFPLLRPSRSVAPPVFGAGNRLLAVYVTIGAILGLLLPIVYILEGVIEGDKEGIKTAVPHVFLLSSQVFMEGMTFSPQFSLPIRAFVPVFFNALRMLTIIDWANSEIWREAVAGGEQRSELRLLAGRALAVANLVHEYLDPFLGNSVWQSWKEKQTAMMKSIAYSTSSSLPAFSLKDWVQGGKRYFIHDRRLEERKRMKKDEIWRWKPPDPLVCCCWVFGPISFIFVTILNQLIVDPFGM